ncbi:MAG TPA: RagB/SusD family nutrient uptake outer membrane protein [Longimicrobiales bacterium]
MIEIKKTGVVLATVLFLGAAACADLDVTNLNDADAGRALTTAGDVESLVAGSFAQWWQGSARYEGPSFLLSAMSFQHSAWPANAGVYFYAGLPRPPIQNNQVHADYGNIEEAWNRNYKALSAIAAGLRAIDSDETIASELGAERVRRVRAFGKFVQGLAHASLAVLYDKGFVIDETIATIDESGNPADLGEPVSYNEMMNAALGYFDDAIDLAGQGAFEEPIPTTWMGVETTAEDLVRIAHSLKARFRAAVARTPAERQAVDWGLVLADVDEGIQADFTIPMNGDDYSTPWTNDLVNYLGFAAWQQLTYMVLGMADTSGAYQAWLAKPVVERRPNIDMDGDGTEEPVLIRTPDHRFPQGVTLDEQRCNPGTIYTIPERDCDDDGKIDRPGFALNGNNWARPDRGTWRWSYYWNEALRAEHYGSAVPWPLITMAEMNLLAAEARYWRNEPALAANLINITRTAAGLQPTDENGTNTDCVPKLPNGSCGDLLEMLKWEKRLEVQFTGLYGAPWYFDGRAWGDLYLGTPVQFPMPSKELQGLGIPRYTFGGAGGEGAAPGSTYAYPFEQ